VGVAIAPKKKQNNPMSENDYESENEKLKRQLELERLIHESELARAEHRAYVQKDRATEKLAWVSLFLFCAVVIILGLTGVID
jgi:membrane protein required for beta-lactamase induction